MNTEEDGHELITTNTTGNNNIYNNLLQIISFGRVRRRPSNSNNFISTLSSRWDGRNFAINTMKILFSYEKYNYSVL